MTTAPHSSPVAARQAQIITDSAVCALSQLADVDRVVEEFLVEDTADERTDREDLLRHLATARAALRDLYRCAFEIAHRP